MFTCGSLLIMCDQWFPSCDRLTAIAVAVVSADDILSSVVEAGKRCATSVDFVSSPESEYLKRQGRGPEINFRSEVAYESLRSAF